MNYQFILGLIFIFSFSNISKAQEDIITSIKNPSGLIIVDDVLYFSLHTNRAFAKYELDKTSNIPSIVKYNLEAPFGVGLFGNFVYVAENLGNRIYKTDLSGVELDEFLFVDAFTRPTDVEVTEDYYFLCLGGEGRVVRIKKANPNGKAEELISGLDYPTGLCKVGNDLYVADIGLSAIFKIDLTSAEFDAIRLDVEGGPNHLFATDDHLYFSLFNGGKIGRLNLQNIELPIEFVLEGLLNPTGIFIKDNTLYYADYVDQDGKIAKYDLPIVSSLENTEKLEIDLYPNPTINELKFLNLTERMEISLLNTGGQIVKKTMAVPGETLDINNLPTGTYYIHFKNGQVLPFTKL